MNLKLNYKRTFLIGFAFFGILLLWQVYDSWCPTFLTDIFARRMYGISSAELKAGEPEKNKMVRRRKDAPCFQDVCRCEAAKHKSAE